MVRFCHFARLCLRHFKDVTGNMKLLRKVSQPLLVCTFEINWLRILNSFRQAIIKICRLFLLCQNTIFNVTANYSCNRMECLIFTRKLLKDLTGVFFLIFMILFDILVIYCLLQKFTYIEFNEGCVFQNSIILIYFFFLHISLIISR